VNQGLYIAVIGISLIGTVLVLGMAAVGVGYMVLRRRAAAAATGSATATGAAPAPPGRPVIPARDLPPRPIEDHETELFSQETLNAFYDADDFDKTELFRPDGAILVDGSTDPASMPRGHAPDGVLEE